LVISSRGTNSSIEEEDDDEDEYDWLPSTFGGLAISIRTKSQNAPVELELVPTKKKQPAPKAFEAG